VFPVRPGGKHYLRSYIHLRLEEDRRLGGAPAVVRKGAARSGAERAGRALSPAVDRKFRELESLLWQAIEADAL
jgi:hypothetical protein